MATSSMLPNRMINKRFPQTLLSPSSMVTVPKMGIFSSKNSNCNKVNCLYVKVGLKLKHPIQYYIMQNAYRLDLQIMKQSQSEPIIPNVRCYHKTYNNYNRI